MSDDFIFTSESITRGHPDKVCDQISDAIVDHFIKRDPRASVDAECAIASGILFVAVRYASTAKLDIPEIARDVIRSIGYPKDVFDADACTVMTSFADLAAAGHVALDLENMGDAELGRVTASHSATSFGYACQQTPTLMPMPIWLAHRIAEAMDSIKLRKKLPYLLPDGKAQVSIEYRDGRPARVQSVTVVASQVDADSVSPGELRERLIEHVVRPACEAAGHAPDDNTRIYVNPEGPLIGGGPSAHSGLTGRKTGVDTYGEYARQSGAALSGKDPMRIDRVGAYAARYAAKNVVAAGLATECEVSLSYSVGVAEPVSVRVRTFGTGRLDDQELSNRVRNVFDFRVAAIVRDLRLRELPGEAKDGFYGRLAVYGHMGRTDLAATWEETDKVDALA